MKTRIIITKAELVDTGMLITEIKVIDGMTGEELRVAKITPELIDFFKTIEIGVDDYLEIQKAKEKNPALRKLIESFKLFT